MMENSDRMVDEDEDIKELKSRIKIIVEFTTEVESFVQGSFEMKGNFLVVGKGGGKDCENYLDLTKYLEFRPKTSDFIAKRHFSLIYNEEKGKMVVVNHSTNGILVDYFLVNEEPMFLGKKEHQIRLGQILLNEPTTRFTYFTINLKLNML